MVASLSSGESATTTGPGHAGVAVTYKSISVCVPMTGDPLLSQGNNAPYTGPMCAPGCRCIDGCICGRLEPESEPGPEPEPEPEPRLAPQSSSRLAQASHGSAEDQLDSLMALDAAQRRGLAAALLNAMDPDELRALLQGMRKFPWEVEVEAQTDHSGPLVAGTPSVEDPEQEEQPGSSKKARARKYMPQAKRSLTSIAKATNSKKAKPISLKKARTLIANIYEEKVKADEACDQQGVRRDELPTFVCDFMLHMYGIKSLAMQNLANLIRCIVVHSEEGEKYDSRIHIFGQLSGILAPLDYRTVPANFMLDFLLQLFGMNPKLIDENMNRDAPCFNAEQAANILEKHFTDFNLPMPAGVFDKVLQAGDIEGAGGRAADGLVHIDDLMMIILDEWRDAAAAREAELLAVFKAYDVDGDGNLDLAEFTKIVKDVDSGAAADIETQYAQTEERSDKSMLEMYIAAVEADDDDDDFISAEAFLDECYIGCVGIGVHPTRRQKMVAARAVAKGGGGGQA